MTVHATAVAIGERAVLLRGPSGSGKSDLALRLLALPADALAVFGFTLPVCSLVADDRVVLERSGEHVIASAPEALRNKLEVRGLGILAVRHVANRVAVALAVDLTEAVERMPDPATVDLLGIAVPRLALRPFDASTPLKIALALLSATAAHAP